MKNKKINFDNNPDYQKGLEFGKKLAERLEKENPDLYAEMKALFESLAKGEKNVNL